MECFSQPDSAGTRQTSNVLVSNVSSPSTGSLLRCPDLAEVPLDVRNRILIAAGKPFHPSTKMLRTFYVALKEAVTIGYLNPLNVQEAHGVVWDARTGDF